MQNASCTHPVLDDNNPRKMRELKGMTMSSILTNNGAMVALQTMRGINKGMQQVQSEISTGKSVGDARDNAAVWAISKTMESDVRGFKGISDSLSLGSATVAVGRQAAETTAGLLTEMKGLIVSAQEQNVDRNKIQTDIDALKDQIQSVVGAAQFNGLNTVNGSQASPVNVLSSLDRDADGGVRAAQIGVSLTQTNLTREEGTAVTGLAADLTVANAANDDFDFAGFAFLNAEGAAGGAVALRRDDVRAGLDPDALIEGDLVTLSFSVGDDDYEVNYIVQAGDDADSLGAALMTRLNALSVDGLTLEQDAAGTFNVTNNTGEEIDFEFTAQRDQGMLHPLEDLNVNGTDADRKNALVAIEDMLQASIGAAASFGSAQKRIDIQAEFIQNLSDSLTTGIGAMVDADMEAASARLQALQVQQQLATQSLSIANQAPQNILALFR